MGWTDKGEEGLRQGVGWSERDEDELRAAKMELADYLDMLVL